MTVDLEKERQKLQYVRSRVRELERFRSMDERTFLEDSFYPLAAARALQIALEASFDLCAHIIAHEGWEGKAEACAKGHCTGDSEPGCDDSGTIRPGRQA